MLAMDVQFDFLFLKKKKQSLVVLLCVCVCVCVCVLKCLRNVKNNCIKSNYLFFVKFVYIVHICHSQEQKQSGQTKVPQYQHLPQTSLYLSMFLDLVVGLNVHC